MKKSPILSPLPNHGEMRSLPSTIKLRMRDGRTVSFLYPEEAAEWLINNNKRTFQIIANKTKTDALVFLLKEANYSFNNLDLRQRFYNWLHK